MPLTIEPILPKPILPKPIMGEPITGEPITGEPIPEKTALSDTVTSMRFSFLETAPEAEVARRFTDPRAMVAAIVARDAEAPAVDLEVFLSSDVKAYSIAVETDFGKVGWQPGRATLQKRAADTLLPALIDFSFYEAELRRLENAILPHQATADADVALAYNIRESNRSHWDRLYQTMEQLYRLRLQFARLEPHLGTAPQALPLAARRLFSRLMNRAKVEARLEALNDRMETLEDLYEGAVDRITDHRNYRMGSLLEMGIIVLLAVEVVLLLIHR